MADIAVLGAGAFGTALAIILTRTGHGVALCVRRKEALAQLRKDRANAAYLPGVALPAALELFNDWSEAVRSAKFVVVAVPSRFARKAIAPVAHEIRSDAGMISVIKGIEEDSLMTMSQMLAEVAHQVSRVAVLSGPGFAAELAAGLPAALVAAAASEAVAVQAETFFLANVAYLPQPRRSGRRACRGRQKRHRDCGWRQ